MRSYALQDLDTVVHGRAYHEDLRLRFDVLTKTKPPALCRYWTQRDRGPACSSSAWRRCWGHRGGHVRTKSGVGDARTARSGASAEHGVEPADGPGMPGSA